MKIKFNCSKNDYTSGYRLHFKSQLTTKITPIFILISLLIGILSFIADDPANGILAFGAGGFLSLILLSRRFFLPAYIYNRNSSLGDETLWEFLEDSIHVKSNSTDAKVCWSKFTSVKFGPQHFLLYIGKDQFSVIPRRAFESKEQLLSFEHLLKEKILNK